MKKRERKFELLRIVAMLMIITLHYLDKGGILPKPGAEFSSAGYLAWLLEAFCVPAVNVYVLISAYFLAGSDYRPMKTAKLWIEVFFYSAGLAALALATSIVSVAETDKYRLLQYLFPVVEEHYWFVTAYVLMYLLAPLMNETLRVLSKRTLEQGIGLLLLFLSLSSSILPVKLPIDRMGYDALWFLCLYLTGAYLRYHTALDEDLPGVCLRGFAGYGVCSLLIAGSLAALHVFYQKTGSLEGFINRQYQYNSILCLAASVFLFTAFAGLRPGRTEGKGAELIRRIASASFGVYLIHEHLALRYLWPQWLGTQNFADTPAFLLHWLFSVLAVYGVCMLIDLIRQALFWGIGRIGKSVLSGYLQTQRK